MVAVTIIHAQHDMTDGGENGPKFAIIIVTEGQLEIDVASLEKADREKYSGFSGRVVQGAQRPPGKVSTV